VYFKLAHSLSEALADLEANPEVADEEASEPGRARLDPVVVE
jgi:hypothetical protein